MKIGCLGMATIDTLLFADEAAFEQESVTHMDEVAASCGGKGVVAAVAMGLAGGDVEPFALVGETSELPGALAGRIDDRFLVPLLDRDNRTWIAVAGGDRMITFVSRGSVVDHGEVAARAREFVASVDCLYVAAEDSLLLRAAFEALGDRDLPVALNPSLPMLDLLEGVEPGLLPTLVRRSSVVLCNDWEAPKVLEALEVERWSDLDLAETEVVVTAGAAGGSYSQAPFESWNRFEATPVGKVQCVVGAGDTFNGAYLVARWAHGLSQAESCRRAADLAAIKVAHRGSILPPPDRGASS